MVTKEQYLADVMARWDLDRDDLELLGIDAEPCGCGRASCPGWMLVASTPEAGVYLAARAVAVDAVEVG